MSSQYATAPQLVCVCMHDAEGQKSGLDGGVMVEDLQDRICGSTLGFPYPCVGQAEGLILGGTTGQTVTDQSHPLRH